MRCSSLVISTFTAGALLLGQEPDRADTATIAVTVTERDDTVPKGLSATDFRVLEDGREQSIVSVSEGPGPVSLGIVLESSDTMRPMNQRLGEQAVERILTTLTPEEEACLVMYRQKIVVAFPWTKGGGFPRMEWAPWETIPVSEILNGVRTALFLMDHAAHPRRSVVAVSNTDETASAFQLRQYVVTQAQSETAVYGLRTDDYAAGRRTYSRMGSSRGPAVSFDDIVRDSGGRVFPVKTSDDSRRNSDALIRELRHQYVLKFVTSKPFDGSYRKLKVELRDRKHVRIRHRLGYLAKNPRA